jgi:hypothetical protein
METSRFETNHRCWLIHPARTVSGDLICRNNGYVYSYSLFGCTCCCAIPRRAAHVNVNALAKFAVILFTFKTVSASCAKLRSMLSNRVNIMFLSMLKSFCADRTASIIEWVSSKAQTTIRQIKCTQMCKNKWFSGFELKIQSKKNQPIMSIVSEPENESLSWL